MRAIRNISLTVFFAALLLFLSSLFLSSYRLSDQVIAERFSVMYTASGKSYYEILRPQLEPMVNVEYHSSFGFISDYSAIIKKYNEPLIAAGNWDEVIKDDQLVMITKHSSLGWLADHAVFVSAFCFLGMLLGGILYFLVTGPANEYRRRAVWFSSLSNRGVAGIVLGSGLILFYIILYFFPAYLSPWMLLADPLRHWFTDKGEADQWFLYGWMYCMAMLVMGIRMLIKWKGNRYQTFRTVSVMFFQLCFAFIIPEILSALNQPAVDVKHIWPLHYNYFDSARIDQMYAFGGIGITLFWWGIALFLIGVPLFTYFYGKRWYCSWICGCGGLAETAGDPFRHLSDKSQKAWKIERWMIYSVLVFVSVMTLLVVVAWYSGKDEVMGISSGFIKMIYGFLIGSIFSGVVGTGFYPLMGNRVWCRFGCPLAAYMGIIQRFKSRFRITTNGGQCISCGNCSASCEMGIDVRWYAQRGQNIVRASCVGCGICSSVCPRGVLKLENAPEAGRINNDPILIGREGVKMNTDLIK